MVRTGNVLRNCALLLAVVMTACGTEEKEQEIKKVPEAAIQDTMLYELNQQAATYSDWMNSIEQPNMRLSLDSFVREDENQTELLVREANLNKDFYNKYGKLLVYNSDSSRFIDVYSYQLQIDNENGQLTARTGDPDQEVAVIDPATKKRTRILYCGPACIVQKAAWLNNDIVALMGASDEDGDGNYVPVIWFVNLRTSNTMVYSSNDNTLSTETVNNYTKKMLEKKGISLAD